MIKPFTLNIAGLHIAVTPVWSETEQMCRKYLVAADDVQPPDFSFVMTAEDLERERILNLKGITEPPRQDLMLCRMEPLALYRKIAETVPQVNTWLMHGSVVAVDGEAYMFTAPSGTGKSTHTALWRKAFGDRAVMVNDDKPLLRLYNNQILACGTPWNGKHNLGENIQVPLKGICCLARAEENRLKQLTVEEAFPLIYQQTYRPEDGESLIKTLDLIGALLERVPVWQLDMNNFREDALTVSRGIMRNVNVQG